MEGERGDVGVVDIRRVGNVLLHFAGEIGPVVPPRRSRGCPFILEDLPLPVQNRVRGARFPSNQVLGADKILPVPSPPYGVFLCVQGEEVIEIIGRDVPNSRTCSHVSVCW